MAGFHKDKIKIIFFAVLLSTAFANEIVYAGEEAGRVIRKSGICTSRNRFGETADISIASPVEEGQTIICHDESTVDIILSDGTSLDIYGPASVAVDSSRKKISDPPTVIRVFYGKLKISSKCVDNSLSLKVYTPSAEISAVMADIGIVASLSETYAAIYKYKAAAASSDKKISRAYIVYPGEQIRIRSGKEPEKPEKISYSGLAWWIEKYHLSDNNTKIRGYNLDEGPADWIIRRRDE